MAKAEGFVPTHFPGVRLMHSKASRPRGPISYDASIILIAQGRKVGHLGTRTFTYDPRHYLVLSIPLPFECETVGSVEEPMLGLAIQVDPAMVTELLLELDAPGAPPGSGSPPAIDATPLTPELSEAALRLARCLHSPVESRILGPQIVREITYHALQGGRGEALRALVAPQRNFHQIARCLRQIHHDCAQTFDVGTLARGAGMSVSTFHTHFKAITAKSPLRYLQTVRLHRARVLIVGGTPVTETARQVGYESASQFSREFKRLFGKAPKEMAHGHLPACLTFRARKPSPTTQALPFSLASSPSETDL